MKRKKTKYSNFQSGLFNELPATGDQTNLPEGYFNSGSSSSSSGSGLFNWNQFSTGIIGLADSFVTSFFGKEDSYRATAYNEMLQNEKRTNTVLWVVIGLILALGVFLVIRKTK